MTTRQRSSRTWCHMELPAATKPTNANFVRVIRKKCSMNQGCHKRFYSHMFFCIIYFSLLKLPPPPRAAILVICLCRRPTRLKLTTSPGNNFSHLLFYCLLVVFSSPVCIGVIFRNNKFFAWFHQALPPAQTETA